MLSGSFPLYIEALSSHRGDTHADNKNNLQKKNIYIYINDKNNNKVVNKSSNCSTYFFPPTILTGLNLLLPRQFYESE